MKFNHLGIPTKDRFDGEVDLPHLKMTVSDHENNPYGIQWQRYWDDAPYPELVKTVPHVAFEVDDLATELKGKKVDAPPTMLFVKTTGPRWHDFMRYYYPPMEFQSKLRSSRGRLVGQAARYAKVVEAALRHVSSGKVGTCLGAGPRSPTINSSSPM